jgi:hypothetical protein
MFFPFLYCHHQHHLRNPRKFRLSLSSPVRSGTLGEMGRNPDIPGLLSVATVLRGGRFLTEGEQDSIPFPRLLSSLEDDS